MKILKYLLINVLVILVLIAILDFCSGLVIDIHVISQKKSNKKVHSSNITSDRRDTLENYKNISWAQTHMQELNLLETNYKSYFGWRREQYKGKTINIDSFGIRKNKNNINTVDSTIVFLGGSTIWGTGVNDSNTIPSLYKDYSNTPFYVSNYGESGYTAYQSLMFLQTQIAKGLIKNINLIVSYDGVNNSPTYKSNFGHFREEQIKKALKEQKNKSLKKGYRFFKNTRILIDKLKSKYFTLKSTSGNSSIGKKFSDEDHKQAAIELLESWLMIKNVAENNKARFVCVLQPNIYVGNPDKENLKGIKVHKLDYNYYQYVIKYISEVEKYKVLKNQFIDMTNIFDFLPNVYIDWCHVSPNGNKIIVNELLNYLE